MAAKVWSFKINSLEGLELFKSWPTELLELLFEQWPRLHQAGCTGSQLPVPSKCKQLGAHIFRRNRVC